MLLLALVAGLLGAASAPAFDGAPVAEARPLAAERPWRATGLAHLDLPFGLRARFEARYTHDHYASERLARPFATPAGPALDRDAAIEGRLALARPLARGIELEIAWGGRSPFDVDGFDPLALDRQTVGAALRITPALLH